MICSTLRTVIVWAAMALTFALTALSRAEEPPKLNQPPEGFTALFNGKDFTGWKRNEKRGADWSVVDGILLKGKQGGNLPTEKQFGDCILMVDWRWTAEPVKRRQKRILPTLEVERDKDGKEVIYEVQDAGDSGIYFRGGHGRPQQINLWCNPMGSGELYEWRTWFETTDEVRKMCVPKKRMDKPVGEWNHMVITLKGENLRVELNGEEVINANLPGLTPKGCFAFQDHGHPIAFRNVFIKELE